MLATRRAWLMAGAAVVEPVVVVGGRRRSKLLPGDVLGLVGDEQVVSLGRHLSPLCRGSHAGIVVSPCKTAGELETAAADVSRRARVTLVSWPGCLPRLAELGAAARAAGRSVAMVSEPAAACPGLPAFERSRWRIEVGPDGKTPTAAGYAAWAGALWWWLR